MLGESRVNKESQESAGWHATYVQIGWKDWSQLEATFDFCDIEKLQAGYNQDLLYRTC